MKITQEQFDKLPQLDRIEFRQKFEYIKRNKIDTNPFSFLNDMAILGILLLIAGIGLANIDIETAYNFLNSVMPIFVKLVAIVFTLMILLNIFFSLDNKKKLNRLEEEYFKVEAKHGKR